MTDTLSKAATDPAHLLASYREQVETILLSRQDPVTGLLPASTAVTVHGDYTHAWVRDNVYSILAAWGLARAYQRHAPTEAGPLEAAVVRLMRGLLGAMQRQAHKVERFKQTQDPLDALHAKYDTRTGLPVVGDGDWGHLQLDATALFLLMLGQMHIGGLGIVQTADEIDFIQNLVYYLGRADRTADYGIWERGHKRNAGLIEINASSVGMAKAALETIHGLHLLGDRAPAIHVPADDIGNMHTTLMNLLPRESQSKETDGALLSITGYPAFAVGNQAIALRTRDEVVSKLQGRYGCKRFLRDGHQTVLEDHSRLHYEPGELALFENIESEWPLFFTYLFLDAALRDDPVRAADYRQRLQGLCVPRDGAALLPELYLVPTWFVEAERAAPHSQPRVPNENVPLVWAQSLYLLGQLLHDGLITAADIDPAGRRLRDSTVRQVTVQILVLAADDLVGTRLAAAGIIAPTPGQLAPVQVRHPDDLDMAFRALGSNPGLGLTGRPPGRAGTLSTSQLFRMGDQTLLFLPHFAHNQASYLHLDNRLLVENMRTEIAYLQRRWDRPGEPLLTLRVTEAMLAASGADVLTDFLLALQAGQEPGVRSGSLDSLQPDTAEAALDWLAELAAKPTALASAPQDTVLPPWDEGSTRPLSGQRASALRRQATGDGLAQVFLRSRNPYEQIEVLGLLWHLGDPDSTYGLPASVRTLTEALFARARWNRLWGVIRRAAGLLGRCDESLEDAITQMVLRQKRVAVGRAFDPRAVVSVPMHHAELLARMHASGVDDPRYLAMMQEILVYLGMLIKADRTLFDGTLTLRGWNLLRLVTATVAREHDVTQDEAFNHLLELSPQTVLERLRDVIRQERTMNANLSQVQALQFERAGGGLTQVRFPPESDPVLPDDLDGWMNWRETRGAITRMPEDFYLRVWELLRHCKGLVIGDQLDFRNRIESALAQADMTRGERSFELQVEDLLNNIQAPEYRQLCIEALLALSHLLRVNWGMRLGSYLVLDVIIGHAVRLAWQATRPELPASAYNEHVGAAWAAFYGSPPHQVGNHLLAAVRYLLDQASEAPPPLVAAG